MKRLSKLFSFILCICLFLNACSLKLAAPQRLLPEESSKLQEYDYTLFSHKELLEKIKTLNTKIKNIKPKNEKYDELIAELSAVIEKYKMFKALEFKASEAAFAVQPRSKMTFKFNSYCLNPYWAPPAVNEQFVLRKESPDIPIYNDIALYTNTKEKIDQSTKQHLLWNLKNNVKFEDLPADQQAFLLKMDPMSYVKINNAIKSELKSQFTKYAKSYIPYYTQTAETIQLVKGKTYTYQEYARTVENLTSKIKPSDNKNPIKADGYDIYILTQSSGFSGTIITFINMANLKQFISCFSFLDPLRGDVQQIGFDMPEIFAEHEKYKDIINEQFNSLVEAGILLLGGNEGEIKSYKNNPDKKLELLKAYLNKNTAEKITEKEFGYNGRNDESDAFRHAFWNALMVRDIGKILAEEFATNHELIQAPLKEKNMDSHNNKIGREIGQKLKDAGITSDEVYAKEVLANKDKLIVTEPRIK